MLDLSFSGWLQISARTPRGVARDLGVTLRTVRRWQDRGAPCVVREYMRLRYAGIPCGPKSRWNGFRWRPDADVLMTPADVEITPGEILALPYLHGTIAALRRELEQPGQWRLF